MATRLADRLKQARSRSFLGRKAEIDLFTTLAFAPDPEVLLLYLHGPGGQGKSSLLRKYKELAETKGMRTILLDGGELEAQPDQFLQAWCQYLPHAKPSDPFGPLVEAPQRTIVLIDVYQQLTPIDSWIREEFLPQMPEEVFVVLASRRPPSLAWQADPGWKSLMRAHALRNFQPAESLSFLQKRGIPSHSQQSILDFTHGHPLALAVITDLFIQQPERLFEFEIAPDMIRALLGTFLQSVPDESHKKGLELSGLAYVTTQSLVEEVLQIPKAGQLFAWMRTLSFMEESSQGLQPHGMAREALVADLRWRHPQRYADLHERIRQAYIKQVQTTSGSAQQQALFELIYLHRTNAIVRPFFEWQESGQYWMELAKEPDYPALEEIVAYHEGPESIKIFRQWLGHPAVQVWVWREAGQGPAAFVLLLNGEQLSIADYQHDPVLQAVMKYSHQHLSLRRGDHLALFRYWMAKEEYQGLSALQSSIFLAIVQYYFTPGLAVSMLAVSQPDFWAAVLNYADLSLVPDLQFEQGGKSFGWYLHDWRKCPPMAWLKLMGKREIEGKVGEAEPMTSPQFQLLVLSEKEFSDSVKAALRALHQTRKLLQNPLLSSRLIVNRSGRESETLQRAATLKTLLEEGLTQLEQNPQFEKFHRVLYRTFFKPVGSQESTADYLLLSFSTYRRYLKKGVELMVEHLWEQEISPDLSS